MDHKFTNHLIHETSPYLLQHAHNPVEWYAWNEGAFKKAKKEDKPVLVSIGYAACHWCHVMEKESFEDEKTAAFMNKFFVNIKIDREERPDIDHIYMQACQVLTGGGGWPLNMFLTPDLKPFTGGTYFPPKPAYGKPSWMDVLIYVHETFTKERDVAEQQADRMIEYLGKMDEAAINLENISNKKEEIITETDFNTIHEKLKDVFDPVEGGFGNAPKFPSAATLKYLLRKNFYAYDTDEMKFLRTTLYKMMFGGIYDQVGGGFARYAVDRKWMIPHFEKMLYDNALLVQLYAEAYQFSGDEEYKRIIEETLNFISNEMMDASGGFYSSYDADSEGVEGKYYTWSKKEIENILAEQTDWYCALMNVSEQGNWEHTNILYRNVDTEDNESFKQLSPEEKKLLFTCNRKLYTERSKRIKPGLDDKMILSWNALMCSAFVSAYKAVGYEKYKETALKNLEFIFSHFNRENNGSALVHTYKNSIRKYAAMLEDYAALISACIDVYEISGDIFYIEKAVAYNRYVIENFSDENDLQFYFTEKQQHDVPVRNKDFYDHATPSGNAMMFSNLQKLFIITGESAFKQRSDKMFLSIKDNIRKYPSSFGMWLTASLIYKFPFVETAICGINADKYLDEVNRTYYPNRVIMVDYDGSKSNYPLLDNKFKKGDTLIYNCRNFNCQIPVISIEEYWQQLKSF